MAIARTLALAPIVPDVLGASLEPAYHTLAVTPATVSLSAAQRPVSLTTTIADALVSLVFAASWAVVAVSMFVVMQVALDRGLSTTVAVLLAAPAAVLPLRTTLQVARERSVEAVLTGHLWILNGSIAWTVVALTAIWVVSALTSAATGADKGVLIGAATVGFFPVLGMLVLLNKRMLSR